jgi:5-methylcytosine-specific restriction endonuclease McrA
MYQQYISSYLDSYKCSRHSQSYYEGIAKEKGCTLLSEFKGSKSKLDFICPRGHPYTTTWDIFLQGRRCIECFHEDQLLDIEYIREAFKKENYILHTQVYTGSRQELEFTCDKGHNDSIRWNYFQQGNRCGTCYLEKNKKGENSPRWNPNLTQEEREKKRNYPEYIAWRNAVFKRDNFTCQCCNDDTGGNLIAHHILNFSEHRELRHDIGNGITLCEPCHIDFHNTYGYKNNNQIQIREYILTYKSKNKLDKLNNKKEKPP